MKNPALILAVILIVLVRCGPARNPEQLLQADSFESKLENTPQAILLDVRTAEEFATGHLEGAELIDVQRPDFKEKAGKLDKSKPVFVYCASGIRSERAATILDRMGFDRVYELSGGVREWVETGKPLVGNKN